MPSVRVRSLDHACYIFGVKTWLSTLETVYLLWRCGSTVVGAPASKLGQVWLLHIECVFRMVASLFTPTLPSDETLQIVGAFYLVAMPREGIYPTQGENV